MIGKTLTKVIRSKMGLTAEALTPELLIYKVERKRKSGMFADACGVVANTVIDEVNRTIKSDVDVAKNEAETQGNGFLGAIFGFISQFEAASLVRVKREDMVSSVGEAGYAELYAPISEHIDEEFSRLSTPNMIGNVSKYATYGDTSEWSPEARKTEAVLSSVIMPIIREQARQENQKDRERNPSRR